MSLLGQSFTDIEGTVQPKTPYARAEEQMEKYCKAPSLPLTEDPMNWWHAHEVTFPLLSQSDTCVSQAQTCLQNAFSTWQEMWSLLKEPL